MRTQKIWVVDDPHWKESPEKTRKDGSPLEKTKEDIRLAAAASQKSPALAFSFSMIAWGSGQMFIGAYRPGVIFMALMVLFYGTLSAMVLFGVSASRLAAGTGIPTPVIVAGLLVYLFAGLACWLANAIDAYYRTTRGRAETFRGVDNELWPLCASLLFPGWGQFLNGQHKKGIFFLSCGGLGIFAGIFLSLTPYTWPLFGKGPVGHAFETCLIAALLLIPLSLLMWIVSVYDAFSSCKELFLEKLRRNPTIDNARKRAAGKRPMPRLSAILALLLAISVGNQLVPSGYYRNALERVRGEAVKHDMELIPGFMGEAIELFDR